jgi:hypothetical protein
MAKVSPVILLEEKNTRVMVQFLRKKTGPKNLTIRGVTAEINYHN